MRARLTPEDQSSTRSHPVHPAHPARPARPVGGDRPSPGSGPVSASSAAGGVILNASTPLDTPETAGESLTSPGVTPGTPESMQEGKGSSPLTAVVARAQAGATDAVEELMREVRVRAVRYLRARLGPLPPTAHAAEDAAQEVCTAVLTSLPRYDERGVSFESVVYWMCARKVADLQRALNRGPDPRVDNPDGSDGDADLAVLAGCKDEAEKAWMLLDRLPEQQREVLTLRVAVGLSATETADVLDMTAGSVRVSQHRALNRLRELLARQEAAG